MAETEKKTEEPRKFAKILKDYFGFREGDKMIDFANELKELSTEEKVQLADGIENGTLTY